MFKPIYRRYYLASVILGILLVSFVFAPLSVLLDSVRAESSWRPGWQYRKSITINHALVGASGLVNFPILIDITDSNLSSHAQPDGDDIYFTDSNGVQLSHEIEFYSSGHLVAWVKVPSLSSSVDTMLYMYYGNAAAENQEDPSGVWDSNFMMVQHLSETSGTQHDSTFIGNNGTAVNGVVQGTTGKIDGADNFDGSDDYVTVPHSNTLTGFTGAFMVEAWIKMDDVTRRQVIANKWTTATPQRAWFLDYESSTSGLGFFVSQDGTNYPYYYANQFKPTIGAWYYIVAVWRSGQPAVFYVNGSQIPTSTAQGGTVASIYNNPSAPLDIGRSTYITGRNFDGVIDEVRISNSARSPEWISTCYNNQISTSNFYTVGPEESSGAPIVSNPDPPDGAINVITSLSQLSFNLTDPNGDHMNFSVTTNPNIGSGSLTDQVNGIYSFTVSGLTYSTFYTWQLNVTDGVSWTNKTYTFNTQSPQSPPVVSNATPPDGATNVPTTLDELDFNISDLNGDLMNVTATTSPDIGSSNATNYPDTPYTVPISGLAHSTLYTWYVKVTDGFSWTNVTYHFTTQSPPGIKYKALAINHSLVAANLVNFPVLIDRNDSDLKNYAQPDGSDIYFTDSNGVQLGYEIEFYNSSDGHLVAWVNVPSLSTSADTILRMYYGDPGAGEPENPAAVWDSNFVMVQHLSETSGSHYDSTVNGNNGSPVNGVVQGTTGKIDGADNFDGTNDYVAIPHSSTITGFTQAFTASFWIEMDSVTGRRTILNKYNINSQRAWSIDYDSSRGTNALGLFVSSNGVSYSYWYASFSPAAGNWYHIAVVWRSGQQPLFYVNGALVTSTTSTALASVYNNAAEPLYIGRSYTSGRYFDGVIDEVQVSNVARSAQWINTSYKNQNYPSLFFNVSGPPPPTPPYVVSHFPLAGQTNVPRNPTIVVNFSEPMDSIPTQSALLINSSVPTGIFAWPNANAMSFTPTNPLANLMVYNVTITTAARDLQGENMSNSYTWTFTTEQSSPPYVVSHVPIVGATNVTLTPSIEVNFSEPMDQAATQAAFSINASVSPSFVWPNATAMRVSLSSSLNNLTSYNVTISTAARDLQGENMTSRYSWVFTTGNSSKPYVVSVFPAPGATGVLQNARIQIKYSEPMDPTTAQGAFSINGSVKGTFSWPNASAMTFVPYYPLLHNTTYNVALLTAARDLQGENMTAAYNWTFTTEITTKPYVVSVVPAPGAVNQTLVTTVQVTFSEAMNGAYTVAHFSTSPFIPGYITWNSATTRMTLNTNVTLPYNTLYTITISDALDQQGEYMIYTPFTSNFTTKWPPSQPYVVSHTPAVGETNVTNTEALTVNFSEPMAQSATEAAFSVNGSNTKIVALWPWPNSSAVNLGIIPLLPNTSYNITISTAARDLEGENMTTKYTWVFTTGNYTDGITPKWSQSVGSSLGSGESSPLIADITSDPGKEIVYVGGDTGGSSGAVLCLSGIDGHQIWSYTDTYIGWNVQPQMGDIDNDGNYEIVVSLYYPTGILVLKTDKSLTGAASRSLYWKRTGIGGSSYTSKPLVVDPDGDGFWMIFAAPEDVRGYGYPNGPVSPANITYTARIWAFNYDGREIKNGLQGTAWNQTNGQTRSATGGVNGNYYQWFAWRPCSGGFSMADTDNDGTFELFQNDRDMYYGDGDYAKGTICWEWNATSQGLSLKWYQPDMLVSSHTPILVDVDKDGVLDVVAANMRGGLAIFNSTTGAEIKKDYNIGLPSHYQPVVYDIDHDGNPEILLADGDHPGNSPADIVVFDLTLWKVDARMYVGPCKFPPAVGEVTGDGIMDIIAVSDTGMFVFDGSHNPSIDHTYPLYQVPASGQPYQNMYAVVQDIDNDGRNEIVYQTSAYRVYAYDTPGLTPNPPPRSEVQYYNERRTGAAEYVPPVFDDRTAPIVSNPYPSKEATNVPVNLARLNFTIRDLQNDLMNYTVTTNMPVDIADIKGVNKSNGTFSVDVTSALLYHTKYAWSVSVTDGTHWNNKTYTLTTPDGTPPGSPPTQGVPLLNSSGTDVYQNATSVNLICTNQTTADPNGDNVTNIYRWLRNGQPIANLMLPFDTDNLTTAKDYSGYGNNGQIHGATWTSNGKVGGAYRFDGLDDYMIISDGGAGYYNGRIYSSSLGGGGNSGNWSEMTVEMWVNLAALSTKESTRILMKVPSYEIGLGSMGGSTRANTRLSAGVWLDNPDSGDNAGPPNSSPKATEYWSVSAPSSMPLSINTWYHVAFTYKDGKGTGNSILTLYINGVAVTTSTSRTTRGPIKASSGEPLYIGWFDYFNGMIDEVNIYSRCLSGEQISQHYNETNNGLTSSSTLSRTETRTGETWTCEVIPNDSHQDGTARISNPLLSFRVLKSHLLPTTSKFGDSGVCQRAWSGQTRPYLLSTITLTRTMILRFSAEHLAHKSDGT